MYKLECKRLLKTRSTRILLAVAVLFTIFMCCVNVFDSYRYIGYSGTTIRGLAAIEYKREMGAMNEGDWTSERIRDVFTGIRETVSAYDAGNIPEDVYAARVEPYTETFMYRIPQVFGTFDFEDLAPEKMAQYYAQRKAYIAEATSLRCGAAAAEAALRLDANTTEPFYWEFGFGTGSDTQSVLPVCLFAVAVVCSVICAPVFASDYASGADDIQRCSRYGRRRLGKARILAAMTLSTGLYLICAAIFLAVTLAVFGADSTSAQLALDALVLVDITMNGVLVLALVSGFLSVLAMTAFTLWLSARMKSGVAVLAVTLAVAMAPTFLIVLLRDTALGDWLRALLPSGGLGLGTGMLVDIQVGKFLTVGPVAVWTPFVTLAVPVIETPLFALLARRTYIRHEDAPRLLPRRR